MPLLHLALVALIQGLTEFLPISSSGHLILLPNLTGLDDQGLMIDVAVHVGTLGAVILYFRADVALAFRGLGHLATGQRRSPPARFAFGLIVATIPVIIAGLVIKLMGWDAALRSVAVIGWATLGFGLVLYWADRTGTLNRVTPHWTLKDAILMGLAQALALIPGTSRSGITITAARRLGFDRPDAARLAMLMSIPTILASGALLGLEVVADGDITGLRDAAIAAVLAMLAALAALAIMMRLARSISFTPYVIYRVVLGLALLVYAYA